MKIGPQVYVKDSFEAVERYCDAFGAKIGLNLKHRKTLMNIVS